MRIATLPKAFLSTCVTLASVIAPFAANAQASEARHASGIAMAGPGPYLPSATGAERKMALNEAWLLAQDNPDDFGYPWIDAQGVVIHRPTNENGRRLAAGVGAGAPQRAEKASRSYRELEAIKHEVTDLRKAGIAGADAIWMTAPDELNNRVIVWVNRLDDGLMAELARIYGTQAIAVRVEAYPNAGANRLADTNPYTGGAAYIPSDGTRCTYAFAFTHGLVTAGHCEDRGGATRTSSGAQLGTIGDNDNWLDGTGTVGFPGESANTGDLAFMTTFNSIQLRPRIYNGSSPSSAATTNVASMAYYESTDDESICMSGSTTGETCGWRPYLRNTDIWYDVTREWVRGVTATKKTSSGKPDHGDSGGPVYTYNADGSVVAKGVFSGSGRVDNVNYMYFTEILKAWQKFPGEVKIGGKVSLVIGNQSAKCLDVQGGGAANGDDAILYSCHGGSNQQWYWEWIGGYSNKRRIVNSNGKCLSIDSNLSTNGAWVHQWTCFDNNPGQTWEFLSDGRIVNGYGKCLSVAYNATTNSAKLNQWDCIGAPSQYWSWAN